MVDYVKINIVIIKCKQIYELVIYTRIYEIYEKNNK